MNSISRKRLKTVKILPMLVIKTSSLKIAKFALLQLPTNMNVLKMDVFQMVLCSWVKKERSSKIPFLAIQNKNVKL